MTKLKVPDEVIQAIAMDAMNLFLRRIAASGDIVAPNVLDSRWEDLQKLKQDISGSLIPRWRETVWDEDAGNDES